jgi:putative transcriptional regulator
MVTAYARRILIFGLLLMVLSIGPAGSHREARAGGHFLSGQLLVASPDMPDSRFHGTVIFVVQHDAHGALGLVVNRTMGRLKIADIVAGMHGDSSGLQGDIEIFYGGPVEPRRAFVLHSTDYPKPPVFAVSDRYSVTIDTDILRAIAIGNGPGHSIFTIGYTGWGKGQLEGELKRGDWVLAPASDDILFGTDQGTKWQRAYDRRLVDI